MAIDQALGSSGGSSNVVADSSVASSRKLVPVDKGTTLVVFCNVATPSAPMDTVCNAAPPSTAPPSTVITSTCPATTGTASIAHGVARRRGDSPPAAVETKLDLSVGVAQEVADRGTAAGDHRGLECRRGSPSPATSAR